MRLLHRTVVAVLTLTLLAPAAVTCGASASAMPMAGMACCKKVAAPDAGAVERDCCRINEQLPEPVPAAPLPVPASVSGDVAFVAAAHAVAPTADRFSAHCLVQSRGRPPAPAFLRTAVLLI